MARSRRKEWAGDFSHSYGKLHRETLEEAAALAADARPMLHGESSPLSIHGCDEFFLTKELNERQEGTRSKDLPPFLVVLF